MGAQAITFELVNHSHRRAAILAATALLGTVFGGCAAGRGAGASSLPTRAVGDDLPPPPSLEAFALLDQASAPPRATAATDDEPISIDEIERVVAADQSDFRRCYERGRQKNPDLRGNVKVRIVVDAAGRSTVTAAATDLPDDEVVGCILGHWRAVTFAPPPEGRSQASVVVAHAFVPAG